MADANTFVASLRASISALNYPGINSNATPATSAPTTTNAIQEKTGPNHPPPNGTCPLLSVPKELRLLIYDHYLTTVPTLVKLEQYHYIQSSGLKTWQPSLTLTSRDLRSELLPLFYRSCRFHLQGFNEDGDCEVETFLARTVNYTFLHENLRTVVIHGFILHSGRWLGEFDLGSKFALKVDRHWKHEMEGAYSGMLEDLEEVFERAREEVGPGDSRAPVLRDLLVVMRARGVFLW